MAVAAPPDRPSRKKRKSGPLPEGLEQHSLEALFALPEIPEPPSPLPALATEARPAYVVPPGPVSQLDFFTLAEQEPDAGSWKTALHDNGATRPASASRRRKAKKSTALPEGLHQATLDELFASTSPFAWQEPEPSNRKPEEAYRPAPRRRCGMAVAEAMVPHHPHPYAKPRPSASGGEGKRIIG